MLTDICSDAEIILYHAQFVQSDRLDIEDKILRKAGKKSDSQERRKTIIIGTQVLEQSLDIDFDLLITDICPMDLLLQRIGRLHRHTGRDRPDTFQNAVCHVLGSETVFDNGSVRVYGEWLLLQTVKNLPHQIRIPADISPLVQAVYNSVDSDNPAYQEYQRIQKEKKNSAKAFLLGKPNGAVFSGLLDRTAAGSDTEAEASVCDGVSSVEVLLMMRTADGMLQFLPHQKEHCTLDTHILPDDDICRKVAEQRLRLPAVFCQRYSMKQTISDLEIQCSDVMHTWSMSPWLHGKLLLILDESLSATIGKYRLTYDIKTGLHYESEAKE
ncbi:MAG TPA: hypothetical protein DCG49_11640 [Ruminococcus sp.]|nr:hypothetical protein [Ruminococcus sp.]